MKQPNYMEMLTGNRPRKPKPTKKMNPPKKFLNVDL